MTARTFLPPPDGFDALTYTRSAAAAVGLSLDEAELSEVAANLGRTAGFAALVATVEGLSDTVPAPVFRPVEANSPGTDATEGRP